MSRASEVVFFLGAGASRKADVPDTFGFVKEFQQSMQGSEYQETVDMVIKTLEQWKPEDTDVELLLDTLSKLAALKDEPLLKFFKGGKYILKGYSKKRPIVEKLKDFIKHKATITSKEKVQYLRPLRGFIQQYGQIDVVSVNYDTCIEQFCSIHQLKYQDGFDITWNPSVFEQVNSKIRLYKLHGSVIWYQSDRADYIKLPLMTTSARVRLHTGEKAESLMLYPMKKFDYPEPLLDLMVRVRNLLQDENCKFLVVVGYSFRDGQVVRILQDAARKNEGLCIILIDPKASQIYEGKLKYYDSKSQVPSSLDGRVVCLPYRFEDVLPILKDQYLHNLRFGLQAVADRNNLELVGQPVKWIECVENLTNAEHIEQLESLLGTRLTEPDVEDNWKLAAELYLKMAWNLAANGKRQKADIYLARLKGVLRRIMLDGVNVEIFNVSNAGVVSVLVSLVFNTSPARRGKNREHLSVLRDFLQRQDQYIESRSQMTPNSALAGLFGFVTNLVQYLDSFRDEGIDFEEYARMRSEHVEREELESLRQNVERLITNAGDSKLKSVIQEGLVGVEKQVIAGLFA